MTESRDKPVDFELEELIWNGIEGRLEPADENRLERWAASDPEAQELRESCSDLAEILDRVETEMPPPELRREILRAVERRQRLDRRPAPSPMASSPAWETRWAFLAAGFILGSVALYLASLVGPSAGLDPAVVVGTLALRDADKDLPATFFELREEHDSLSLARSGGLLIAEIRLASDASTHFELTAPGGLQVLTTRCEGAARSELGSSETSLDLSFSGPGLFTMVVAIDDPDSGVVFSIGDREGQLFRQEVEWSDLPEQFPLNVSFDNDFTRLRQMIEDGGATRSVIAPTNPRFIHCG